MQRLPRPRAENAERCHQPLWFQLFERPRSLDGDNVMIDADETLEAELMEHIHLENNVLFARALSE